MNIKIYFLQAALITETSAIAAYFDRFRTNC